MATKLGIRNVSRNGNDIGFVLIALNADGSIDTSFTGTVILFGANFQPIPAYAFTAGDQGERDFQAAATQDSVQIRAQVDGAPSIEVALTFHPPAGGTTSVLTGGDNYFVGNTGTDSFTAGAGDDVFLIHHGSNDIVSAGAGNDGIYFGGAFGAGDGVNGGDGDEDQVAFRGDYSALTTLAATQFAGVENFAILSAMDSRFEPVFTESYDYDFALTGAWAGTTIFNWNALNGAEDVAIDASGATAGAFEFFAGFGADRLVGGAESDGFYFGASRYDPLLDTVTGGGGIDNQIALRGDYTISFADKGITGIQTIALISGSDPRHLPTTPLDYDLTLVEGNVAPGETLTVTGAGLTASETMRVDGTRESDGMLRLLGGAGNDTLVGGGGNDILWGGLRNDSLTGGGGADIFVYTATLESVGGTSDTIFGFSDEDVLDLSAIDAIEGVAGSQFSFIGTAMFNGTAGQLRYVDFGGGVFFVHADTDGDLNGDMLIRVERGDALQMTAGDFVL